MAGSVTDFGARRGAWLHSQPAHVLKALSEFRRLAREAFPATNMEASYPRTTRSPST